jgi:HK97 family phage portal protein
MKFKDLFKKNINIVDKTKLLLTDTNFFWQNSEIKSNVVKAYGSNPFVSQVINKISGIIAKLQYECEDELFYSINENQDFEEFTENFMLELLITGEVFIRKIIPVGYSKPKRIEILRSEYVTIYHINGNVKNYGYIFLGKSEIIDKEQVVHIKLTNVVDTGDKSLRGRSPLSSLTDVYESSNAIFKAENYIFKNGGTIGILTNDSDLPMLSKDIEKINNEWKEDNSGANKFGSIKLTNAKLRYFNIGMSPSDMKLMEHNISKLRIISSAYGLDSSIFNDPANKTYSNRTEAQMAMYEDVILPYTYFYLKNMNKYFFKENNIKLKDNYAKKYIK